ncbi:MAG: hypothetical protein DRI74_03695, partial [Bacteroidetes bacterium]
TGKMGKGGGYIRYVTANKVFDDAVKNNNLSAKTIIQKGSRNMTHSLTEDDLWVYDNLPANTNKYVPFIDYIPRSGSSSSVIVEGVNKGENAENTVMWTVLGFPLTSVTIPVWLHSNMQLPKVLTYDEALKDAPLCHYALELKKEVYSYNWGASSKNYININVLLNADKTGFLQVFPTLENEIFSYAFNKKSDWEKNGLKVKELNDFYRWIDKKVIAFYRENYPQLNIE